MIILLYISFSGYMLLIVLSFQQLQIATNFLSVATVVNDLLSVLTVVKYCFVAVTTTNSFYNFLNKYRSKIGFLSSYSNTYCVLRSYTSTIFSIFSSYSNKCRVVAATVAMYWFQTATTTKPFSSTYINNIFS